MKPIKAITHDTDALIEVGRASVQIVHDLKNQINGLKLYATFLRRRMEKSERPADEVETLNKIMAGLERAAADMNTLVRFGRPVELQRQPRLDLAELLVNATEGEFVHTRTDGHDGDRAYRGDFDAAALTEALQNIHASARLLTPGDDAVPRLSLRREETGAATRPPSALIEWSGVELDGETEVFSSFKGGAGLRLALAARIIQAHEGAVEQGPDALRVRLPLSKDEG